MPGEISASPEKAIAIVGIAGLFPGSETLGEFWDNICAGVDSTSDVRGGRWLIDPDRAFDPRIGLPDHVYSRRGGYVPTDRFDPGDLKIEGIPAAGLDPVFQLALHVGQAAWRDAKTDRVDSRRAGVIFGNIVLPVESVAGWSRDVLANGFEEQLGLEAKPPRAVEPLNAFPAGLPAALVARVLGLAGPAYTLDAACATSLYSIALAAGELQSGRADAMLCGGVSRPDPLYIQMGFSQLRALSAAGRSCPFDQNADGLVAGEGAGMFVLKRLEDALEHGDRIYGLVASLGLSNDCRGDLLAPSTEGQLRAMRLAYHRAGWNPADVDLIECHATGAPVGDAVEIESLKSLWGESGWKAHQCAIGSVKSNIGHALTAAGAAGLLKVLLALKNRTLPPTANFKCASPKLGLDRSPFRVLKQGEPWPERRAGEPRRAAVSGFGFGGINAHVLIEEWSGRAESSVVATPGPPSKGNRSRADRASSPIAIVGLGAHFGPFDGLSSFRQHVLFGDRETVAAPPRNWWGVPETRWFRSLDRPEREFRGFYIEHLELRVDQFRIPPRELGEMLPQQLLMLRVAAEALDDARWDDRLALSTGVLIGIGLDLNTTNYHLRWSLDGQVRKWKQMLASELPDADFAEWIDELKNAASLALSANRTTGSLGGMVASRIAREFRIGGPSFTVSCDETSGIQALAVAIEWLRRGDLDAAIVGAVDLAGDLRTILARRDLEVRSGRNETAGSSGDPHAAERAPAASDGAVALVLKRLEDARRDGDQVHAVLRAVDSGWESPDWLGAGVSPGYVDIQSACPLAAGHDRRPGQLIRTFSHARTSDSFALGSIAGDLGACGAASGLAAVAKAALCLEEQIIPGLRACPDWLGRSGAIPGSAFVPEGSQFWLRNRAEGPRRAGVLASNLGGLRQSVLLEEFEDERRSRSAPHSRLTLIESIRRLTAKAYREPARASISSRHGLAFVYPGLGNQFPGMGRALSLLWPDVLCAHDAENEFLRDQLDPGIWWADDAPHSFDGHREPILGSVSLGCFVTDLLRSLGIEPDAAIGYSLGETAALVALRAWRRRDEMFHRLKASQLFHSELAGRCDAARRVWGVPASEPVDWVAGIVPRSSEVVREVIARRRRVEVLIKNTPNETVIGGSRRVVEDVVAALKTAFFEVSTVSTVHCSIGREVEREYRALHDVETEAPPLIAFYSGVWGRRYQVDRQSAASAIAAQASATIDFPRVIEQAYQDGIRIFLEIGPGTSCSRLIGQILRGRPHLACSACPAEGDPIAAILDVLGRLIAEGVPVDVAGFCGREMSEDPGAAAVPESKVPSRSTVRVEVRGASFRVPALPAPPAKTAAEIATTDSVHEAATRSPLWRSILDSESAVAAAHGTFLRVAHQSAGVIADHAAYELELIRQSARRGNTTIAAGQPPVVLDRRACLEFAVGSAAVLGPEYAALDGLPTRVRLPDEPLMLVDRVRSIEGIPRSMQSGRIVTEHVVRPQAWYLDGGRIVPSIAIEAGQADLLLCGYLGVDFETKGLAVYRLLDATVTFHSALPREGHVIRYDIRIDSFFRQGMTILFRFRLDATVGGQPFLSMRDGCAGFFTPEELSAGRGIIPHTIDLRSRAASLPESIPDLVPSFSTRLEPVQLEALRRADLAGAFGSPFDRGLFDDPLPLPGGRLNLLNRVTSMEATAGPTRLGFICAEAEIHPDDWFLVCHFVDDRVMPGTLMYESCLQALRILLMRMGWVGRRGQVVFEPIPGVAIRLKCRGQVIESTSLVTYEITVKERGYRPEPYAIADALVRVEGKAIVELSGISLQLTGTDRQELETLWGGSNAERAQKPATSAKVFFDRDRILAFALGNPVKAFGERYRAFQDGRRFLARLPAPPYQCVDRILHTDATPWVMSAGTAAVAEYDIDPGAWFFEADRGDSLPFAILLEIALQPCGWLAAYMGSALNSEEDLVFRNLGGTGRQHRRVSRESGTLTTRVKSTKITSAAGMILQSYEFAVHSGEGPVYDGTADFGFFPPRAMAEQVGIRDAVVYLMSEEERSRAQSLDFPVRLPFPDSRWRMVDRVDEMLPDGGPQGLGLIRASTQVDPSAWFFKAHFMNDPVWPGSLGLESLLQLLKVMAVNRWGSGLRCGFESPALGETHRWTYRGQIVPTDHRVTVQGVIKACDDRLRRLIADGHLEVDGKIIYQMHDFAIGALES
jgi:acyl transferase domain-containing protein/3-hydroxymyristoyl/3-hydroxydecanoyl-(acyl carrier protein) dehydratase